MSHFLCMVKLKKHSFFSFIQRKTFQGVYLGGGPDSITRVAQNSYQLWKQTLASAHLNSVT